MASHSSTVEIAAFGLVFVACLAIALSLIIRGHQDDYD